MENYLWLVQLGATVPGRLTEQHDVYMEVAPDLESLKVGIRNFWPGCKSIHVDGFERIEIVDGYKITIIPADKDDSNREEENELKLFFLNLGGYREGSPVEWHHQMLVVAETLQQAISQAKKSPFYKSMSVAKGPSHIDNRYGVAIDEAFNVKDILPEATRSQFDLKIEPLHTEEFKLNKKAVGYFKLTELGKIKI